MLRRALSVLIAAVVLVAALVAAVKAEVIRPNEIVVPAGIKSVDTSEYQGELDFDALSGEGVEFVYAKATEGSVHVDAQFAASCEQARGSDIALGAYHFFSFDSPGDEQAGNFIASAKATWDDPSIRALRPAVDVEWYGDKEQNPPEAEGVRRELRAFVEDVESACGEKPLIYVGNDIYDRYLRGYFDDCDLWIACRKWPAWVEWLASGKAATTSILLSMASTVLSAAVGSSFSIASHSHAASRSATARGDQTTSLDMGCLLGEVRTHVIRAHPAFRLSGYTASFEFGDEVSLCDEAIIIGHVEDGVATVAILGEKDWGARADIIQHLGIAAQGRNGHDGRHGSSSIVAAKYCP